MQKECKNSTESIYKLCRKEAAKYNEELNARDRAADKLCVSESSLRNYELELTQVPSDVVVRMADLYGAPELEVCYCKNDCPIGKRSNMSTRIKGIEQITCSLLNHADIDRMHVLQRDLLSIASDGKVNQDEEETLKSIVYELSQLAQDVMELQLYLKKYGGSAHGDD